MKSILILGGSGFIGKHLTRKHLDLGDEVMVIDSLETSNEEKFENVRFLKSKVQDVKKDYLLDLSKESDIIYCLAGSVGVEYVDKNPSKTIFNNMDLVNYLLPIFEEAQTKVIFSSTSEVYGDKDSGDFKEEDNCSIPPSDKLRWGYAASKMMSEFLFAASTFPYNIIRFFNIVGPGQLDDYGMVIPKFINLAKAGEDLMVFGSGEQVRCFCHIDDAIEMILAVSSTEKQRQIYNIGNPDPITINDLAELVVEMVNNPNPSKIKKVEYKDFFSKNHADIMRRVPNIEKVSNLQKGLKNKKKGIRYIIKDIMDS